MRSGAWRTGAREVGVRHQPRAVEPGCSGTVQRAVTCSGAVCVIAPGPHLLDGGRARGPAFVPSAELAEPGVACCKPSAKSATLLFSG